MRNAAEVALRARRQPERDNGRWTIGPSDGGVRDGPSEATQGKQPTSVDDIWEIQKCTQQGPDHERNPERDLVEHTAK